MTRGPSGSVSQPGTLPIVPGIDMGTTEEPLKHPALPNDAPSPGAFGSSNTTSCPLRSKKLAVVTPTIPAPITATAFLPLLFTMSIRLAPRLSRTDCMDRNGQVKVRAWDAAAVTEREEDNGRAAHYRHCGRRGSLATKNEASARGGRYPGSDARRHRQDQHQRGHRRVGRGVPVVSLYRHRRGQRHRYPSLPPSYSRRRRPS